MKVKRRKLSTPPGVGCIKEAHGSKNGEARQQKFEAAYNKGSSND